MKDKKVANFISLVFPEKNIRIADVACGCYHYLYSNLKEMNYENVQAFDPWVKKSENINNREFKENDLKDFDLIASVFPCQFTFDLISMCQRNKKSFVVLVCKCFPIRKLGELPEINSKDYKIGSDIKYILKVNLLIENLKTLSVAEIDFQNNFWYILYQNYGEIK